MVMWRINTWTVFQDKIEEHDATFIELIKKVRPYDPDRDWSFFKTRLDATRVKRGMITKRTTILPSGRHRSMNTTTMKKANNYSRNGVHVMIKAHFKYRSGTKFQSNEAIPQTTLIPTFSLSCLK